MLQSTDSSKKGFKFHSQPRTGAYSCFISHELVIVMHCFKLYCNVLFYKVIKCFYSMYLMIGISKSDFNVSFLTFPNI